MTIELSVLIEIIGICVVLKLICREWTPPIQRSLQAILVITIGTSFGCFLNPTKEGLVTGIVASGFAFYGGELLQAFKSVADDAKEFKK
ncbi:MAG: hypothetical protein ACRCX2_22070 [Paraclostridium sp.]